MSPFPQFLNHEHCGDETNQTEQKTPSGCFEIPYEIGGFCWIVGIDVPLCCCVLPRIIFGWGVFDSRGIRNTAIGIIEFNIAFYGIVLCSAFPPDEPVMRQL